MMGEKQTPVYEQDTSHGYGYVDHMDVRAIEALLNGSVRNPNLCITKTQLKEVCAQLLARNHMLEKRIKELEGK